MIKRVCDFCEREINDDILYIGADYAKSLKIINGSDDEIDVCPGCSWKIKLICKNKELLKNSDQESKPWEKDNPTLGKSTKYPQEEYNPSNIGVNR